MRLALVAVAAALILPATATGSARCENLESQIDHYQGMVERAKALDNQMWEERAAGQVHHLRERRGAIGCPVPPDEDDQFGRALVQLLYLAGQAALTYFTFGAL